MRISTIIAVVPALFLAGCLAAGGPQRSVTIEVRDRITCEPVSSAVVTARPEHAFDPSYPHEFIQFPGFKEHEIRRGRTGDEGTIAFSVVSDYPVKLVVLAPGYTPAIVELFKHDIEAGTGWVDPDAGTPQGVHERRLQVRIVSE